MGRRIVLALLILSLSVVSLSAQSRPRDRRKAVRKIEYVLDYLQQNYIDEVPLDTLVEAALVAIFDKLDPHSRYMPTNEMQDMYSILHSQFAGVGISYTTLRDTLVVRRIIEGSPAEDAGLQYGDRITSIDNRSIVGLERDSITHLLRGQKGTTIHLGILRRSDNTKHSVDITHDNVASTSIKASMMLNDTTAYIRISNFARSTPQDFRRALATMSGYNSLIIDLRGNSGGLLPSVIDICGIFLPANTLITTTEGRKVSTDEYRTKLSGELCDLPLTILIDEESASASELFAGAMQDNDRAVIIGRTSFGKGLVQRLINLGDNTGMAVTRARYKTPSGRIIQRPYAKGDKEEYYNDRSRYNQPDSIAKGEHEIYYTLNEQREVYGGGGIIPDIYVAAKSIDTASYIGRALSRGLIEEVVIDYVDRVGYTNFMERYPTADVFAEQFAIDSLSQSLIQRVMHDTEPSSDEQIWLGDMIRAYIARDIFGEEIYISIYMGYDEPLMRAIELHKR